MQGSVAITTSPVIMENVVFRQRLGQSLTLSVLQRNSSNFNGGFATPTSRCLFGAPDTKQSKDLVKEVELKNALSFGKRFNFDIVSGEPFPSAKKMKLSHNPCDDSDEENKVNVLRSHEKDVDTTNDNEGYVWTEKYTEDHMAMCNKHAGNSNIVGPTRNAVPLLFAPIVNYSNHPVSVKPGFKQVKLDKYLRISRKIKSYLPKYVDKSKFSKKRQDPKNLKTVRTQKISKSS